MRILAASLLALAASATTASAQQREELDYRYALFMDGSTARGSVGSVFDNVGLGASADVQPLSRIAFRATGSYDRVASGGAGEPNRLINGFGDIVLYPVPEPLVRVYAFVGVGVTHVGARVDAITAGTTIQRDVSSYTFAGLDAGAGLELGAIFIQYRVPPRSTSVSGVPINYNLVSLGFRF